jgi:hypothetical protein
MNNLELFAQVKMLSLELRTLIRQGVKEGVEERIDKRNALLQEWFMGVKALIDLTNDQQLFLEDLLQEEQQLLDELKGEQKVLFQAQRQQQNAKQYLQ